MLNYQIRSQLDFYSISTTRLELQYEPLACSLKDCIEDTLKPFQDQVSNRRQTVNYLEYQRRTSDNYQLHSDWKVYKEILFHIFQNAVKFNRNLGTLTISVRIAPETKKDSNGSLK
jgi:signal transduction histidine kinase